MKPVADVVGIHAQVGLSSLKDALSGRGPTTAIYEDVVRMVAEAVGRYAASCRAAQARSKELTDAGIAELEAQAEVVLRAELQAARDSYAVLKKRLESEVPPLAKDGELSLPRDPVARNTAELRHREIRESLRGKSALEIEAVYSTGSPEVQAAIENAPMPMLPPDVISLAQESRSREKYPEAWSVIEDLQAIVAACDGIVGAVQGPLGKTVDEPAIAVE